jgi:hypothetical protein
VSEGSWCQVEVGQAALFHVKQSSLFIDPAGAPRTESRQCIAPRERLTETSPWSEPAPLSWWTDHGSLTPICLWQAGTCVPTSGASPWPTLSTWAAYPGALGLCLRSSRICGPPRSKAQEDSGLGPQRNSLLVGRHPAEEFTRRRDSAPRWSLRRSAEFGTCRGRRWPLVEEPQGPCPQRPCAELRGARQALALRTDVWRAEARLPDVGLGQRPPIRRRRGRRSFGLAASPRRSDGSAGFTWNRDRYGSQASSQADWGGRRAGRTDSLAPGRPGRRPRRSAWCGPSTGAN